MEDTAYSRSGTRIFDISVSDTLADFERLRISALTKAAEISPLVNEVTIGPTSPQNKTTKNSNQPTIPNEQEMFDLINDRISDDLRYTLILKDYESRIQEFSEHYFKNLVEKMVTSYVDWKKQNNECKPKSLELRARKLQLAMQLRENDNLTVLEKAKLDEQELQMINQQTLENMNKILEEQSKSSMRMKAIVNSHTKTCICYNEISYLVQSGPQAKEIVDGYVPTINTIIANIKVIMDNCKTGSITDHEVKQAELLSIKIENIKTKITGDLNRIKQQEILRKQKEEQEEKRKELETKQATEAKALEDARIQEQLVEQAKRAQCMFFSEKNYANYEQLESFLDNYENSYKDLLDNASYKKFRFDCQKAVNTPVNALSSVSGTHMRDKFDKLASLLRGERVKVLDTFVTATQHPQGLNYCTALLAKKIVRQGDLLVSSNPEAAFPLAAVTIALWSQFPEFGKLLQAYFHRFCPYLVPMLLPQKEGQSDKEFYLSRGYTYNDEGAVEKQDKFLKRMSGIFRLHCAIWIAKTPRFINASNPHGLRFAWQWLASFMNLKPEPDISATLIHDFFTVCGSEFLKSYKRQCIKIIKLLSTEYLRILQNIDEGGPKTRFEVFLQNVLKTGDIPPPNGLLSSSTW